MQKQALRPTKSAPTSVPRTPTLSYTHLGQFIILPKPINLQTCTSLEDAREPEQPEKMHVELIVRTYKLFFFLYFKIDFIQVINIYNTSTVRKIHPTFSEAIQILPCSLYTFFKFY